MRLLRLGSSRRRPPWLSIGHAKLSQQRAQLDEGSRDRAGLRIVAPPFLPSGPLHVQGLGEGAQQRFAVGPTSCEAGPEFVDEHPERVERALVGGAVNQQKGRRVDPRTERREPFEKASVSVVGAALERLRERTRMGRALPATTPCTVHVPTGSQS